MVKWKNLLGSEATWESIYLLNQQFPHFHLEDKVNLEPRGIVRPPIIHTYQRRGRKVNGQMINDEGKRGGDRACGAQAQK